MSRASQNNIVNFLSSVLPKDADSFIKNARSMQEKAQAAFEVADELLKKAEKATPEEKAVIEQSAKQAIEIGQKWLRDARLAITEK